MGEGGKGKGASTTILMARFRLHLDGVVLATGNDKELMVRGDGRTISIWTTQSTAARTWHYCNVERKQSKKRERELGQEDGPGLVGLRPKKERGRWASVKGTKRENPN